MAVPSLYPLFMLNPFGGGVGGGDGLVLTIMADPDVELEPDLTIEVIETPVNVEVEPEIVIEVE